jgi:hypothetical protein
MNYRGIASDAAADTTVTPQDSLPDISPPAVDIAKPSKDQRAARLSMLLLAMVGVGTQIAHAEAPISYGGPADLSIAPEVPSVQLGTEVTADVGFTGLQQSLIGGYDLTIDYDPTLLAVNSVTFGTYLDGPDNSFQVVSSNPGSLEVYEVALPEALPEQSGYGAVPLFDITFDTLSAGTSALTFDPVANAGELISDQNGNQFTNFVTYDSSVSITAPTTVQAPEIDPGSAAGALTLFVGGVLVYGSRRTRKEIS